MDDDRDMSSAGESEKGAPELYALVRHAGGYRLTRKEFLKAAAGAAAGAALFGCGRSTDPDAAKSPAEPAPREKPTEPPVPTAKSEGGKDEPTEQPAPTPDAANRQVAEPLTRAVRVDLDADADALKKTTIYAHVEGVNSLAFSPNGKLLASGGTKAKTVKLWDVSTGTCVRILRGHTANVHAVAFSPDGKLLASGDCAGVIILWDLADPKRAWLLFDNDAKEGKVRECRSQPGGAAAACTCNTIFLPTGGACTCDQVCTCNTISTGGGGGGGGGGGHYWHPNG